MEELTAVSRKNPMESFKRFMENECGLKESDADSLCKYYLEHENLSRDAFVNVFALTCRLHDPYFQSSSLAILCTKAYDIFASVTRKPRGRTMEHLSYSSSSGDQTHSFPPLIPQHKGSEALDSPVKDDHFPPTVNDTEVDILWPIAEWNEILDKEKSCEAKFTDLLEKQVRRIPEVAKSAFIKGTKTLCDPKIPDFFLVIKNQQEATTESVGAILFTQSTSENNNSYCSKSAVGEAISVGHIFLRNASQQRHFVIVGLTNLKKIRWFKVERPGMAGQFHGCRSCESSAVRHSLAGFMCCSLDILGISTKSIMVEKEECRLGRWLGEGATSNVYVAKVNNQAYAVKVAKAGHSVSLDIENLQKLKGIKGIPSIVSSYSHPASAMFITPVCEQFSLELMFRKKMQTRLGELVDTLKCAHDRCIVNRDIRVSNILIAEDQFIIVDWGYATTLHKSVSYAGTTHFASAKVLNMLEKGVCAFPIEVSDDLVSLVRSLYALSRHDQLYVQKALTDLDSDEFAQIREFWENEMEDNALWQEAERHAEQGNYADLKFWITSWAKSSL